MDVARQKKRLRRLCVAVLIAGLFLVVLIILRSIDKVGEFLHRNLSASIVTASGKLTSLVPFSLFELLLYVVVTYFLVSLIYIVVVLFRKRWLSLAIRAVSLILCVLVIGGVYFASVGFAYTQYSKMLAFEDSKATYEQLVAVSDYVLYDFNNLALKFERDKKGMIIPPYSDKVLAQKLIEEYKRFDEPSLNPYTPVCKTVFSSRIMSEIGIAGVYFGPFGEANINRDIPPSDKPFVMAHELAHAKGIMREDEADMMAALLTLTSEDDYIRYSGYMARIDWLFYSFYLYHDDSGARYYYDSISPLIQAEYLACAQHWASFNLLDDFFSKITNLYLNIMGQKEGTNAYNPDVGTPIPEPEPSPEPDPDPNPNPDPEPNPNPNPDPDPNPNPNPNPEPSPEPEYIYPDFSPIQRLFFNIFLCEVG